MKFRERLMRFMSGRYGGDQLNQALIWACIAMAVLNLFMHTWVLYIFGYALLLWMGFRMFSRNVYKRADENRKFLQLWGKVKSYFLLQRNRIRDYKTHIYRTCPHCGAALRFARRGGSAKKANVTCPRCGKGFEIKL
ncbi:MAG: hypothetical protein VB111_07565 [Clostridiaceae bacterium]|nr:hypothetical protein [Clostridiaceae bacterium]